MSTTSTIPTAAIECQEAGPAELFADRYELTEALGRGSAGSVYRARDVRTGSECAVKLLHRTDCDAVDYARFVREAVLASELFHPHIVEVREFGHDAQGTPYLVMELLSGPTLYEVLRQRGRLPVDYALELLRQIGSAIHTAHIAGIVHRDIKPHNVVLHRVGSGERATEIAKVVDFGIAKSVGAATVESASNLILGTWEYIAPEATWGIRDAVDARADQFSLAVVAYRMLSGRLPFQSQSGDPIEVLRKVRNLQPPPLDQLVPGLPACVVSAVQRALSKRREERFETTQDFVRGLCGLLPKKGAVRASSEALPKSRHSPSRLDEGISQPGSSPVPTPIAVEASEAYAQLSIQPPQPPVKAPELAPVLLSRRARVATFGLYLLSLLVLGEPSKAATIIGASAEPARGSAPTTAVAPLRSLELEALFPALPLVPVIPTRAMPEPAPAPKPASAAVSVIAVPVKPPAPAPVKPSSSRPAVSRPALPVAPRDLSALPVLRGPDPEPPKILRIEILPDD